MFPILNPPPTSLPIPSLWVIPVHQPQESCIMHRNWTGDSFHIWYYICFNAILPNHPPPPSPTKSKRLFYTSVSLLLSRIQGYHYHLSKFHIYVLVYYMGVFLSGFGNNWLTNKSWWFKYWWGYKEEQMMIAIAQTGFWYKSECSWIKIHAKLERWKAFLAFDRYSI